MKRSLVLVALAAAVLGGAAACSDETAGQALPGGTTTSAPDSTTTSPDEPTETTGPTSSAEGGGSLADVDPCDLVTSSAKSTLGVSGSPTPDETPSGKMCSWRVDKGTAAASYTLAVVVFEKLGIDQINSTGAKTPISVGSRKAIQSLRAGGTTCAISIEVTAKSRVDVQVTGGDGATLCAPALDAAKLVEPELP